MAVQGEAWRAKAKRTLIKAKKTSDLVTIHWPIPDYSALNYYDNPDAYHLNFRIFKGMLSAGGSLDCLINCVHIPPDNIRPAALEKLVALTMNPVFCITALYQYRELIGYLEANNLPFVVYSCHEPVKHHCVWYDGASALISLVRYALAQGKKKFAFIGLDYIRPDDYKIAACSRIIEEAGLPLPVFPISAFDLTNGRLPGLGEFDCLICATDWIAIHVSRALPVNAAPMLIGYNNDPLLREARLPVQTVHVPFEEIGASCVDLCRRIITDPTLGHQSVELAGRPVLS